MSRATSSGTWWDTLLAVVVLALLSAAAVRFVYQRGYILYYGDAVAHLNTARRITDSRTPGLDQLGTVWLPLPHLLMVPLAKDNRLWQTGLAGAIPSAVCFVLAGAFLFAAAKSVFSSRAAGAAAAALLALNPNLLYLQSTPMTEPIFLACLMAILYCTVRFRATQSLSMAVGAGLAALAGTLTRYEGWFLIPFVALYFLFAAKRRQLLTAAVFCILAILGPLAWLAHDGYYSGDFLESFRGPHSPKAIQGGAAYPGDRNWAVAWLQFRTAAGLCVGPALLWMGLLGALGAIVKREIWPLLLLALAPVFYVCAVHSGGLPIFAPGRYPFSYYNTRYGLAILPLSAFAASALVAWAPLRLRAIAAVAVIGIGVAPWLLDPHLESSVTWKESEINSHARRQWTSEAAEFLRSNYRPRSGIFTSFGDVTGIFQRAGIPLRDTLTWDNWPVWPAVVARPDLFLREEWAVAFGGDPVQSAINRAYLRGPRYTLQKTIKVKGAPVLEIYKRDSQRGLAAELK
jgi:4-amino-4-deoxy-L-arabinose transferase-like glycosyltransferase